MKGLFSKLAIVAAVAMLFSACGDDKKAEEAAPQAVEEQTTTENLSTGTTAPEANTEASEQAPEANAETNTEAAQAPADNAPMVENMDAEEPKDDMQVDQATKQ